MEERSDLCPAGLQFGSFSDLLQTMPFNSAEHVGSTSTSISRDDGSKTNAESAEDIDDTSAHPSAAKRISKKRKKHSALTRKKSRRKVEDIHMNDWRTDSNGNMNMSETVERTKRSTSTSTSFLKTIAKTVGEIQGKQRCGTQNPRAVIYHQHTLAKTEVEPKCLALPAVMSTDQYIDRSCDIDSTNVLIELTEDNTEQNTKCPTFKFFTRQLQWLSSEMKVNKRKVLGFMEETEETYHCLILDPFIAQRQSHELRNFLRLPKPHRWTHCEFYYSDLDKCIFSSGSDFESCIADYFPTLTERNLRRAEWTQIRRILGRPRRLSATFLTAEREKLDDIRNKVRLIQKGHLPNDLLEIPMHIPVHLSTGTRVTAMIRGYSDFNGLQNGTVTAYDRSNNSYRVIFDHEALGTRSAADYDVLAHDPPATISTRAFFTSRSNSTPKISSAEPNYQIPDGCILGGFSLKLLHSIIQFTKLLQKKRDAIMTFRELNTKAELAMAHGNPYSRDFILTYATHIASLHSVNVEMQKCSEIVETECATMCNSRDVDVRVIIPKHITQSGKEQAEVLLASFIENGTYKVNSNKIVGLITLLTSLLFEINMLMRDSNVWHSCDVQSTIECMKKIKELLPSKIRKTFVDVVEIPILKLTRGILDKMQEDKRIKKSICL